MCVPASLDALSFEPGAVFREERKSTQIPQKELFWQGSGLPPTAASSSLLPSSIHLWGAAYSPSPTPHTQQNLDLDPIRRRADVDACSHKRLIRPPWTYIIHIIDRIQGGFLRGANWFKFNWAGFENTESEFRQIWQDDIGVMGGSNQIVHPHVDAVTLACPHAVRWDEGVWTHSLCQAHNEHISFMKLHPHSVETFIHNTQVSHSLSEVLWCWRTLLYTRFLYKYKVTSFIEFVKYIGLSYTVCYRDLYSVLYRDLWDCANINEICLG